MKKLLWIVWFIIISLVACSSKRGDFVKAAKSAKSVVLIDAYVEDSNCIKSRYGYGSGIIVEEDGYIATCSHVVEAADSITVIYDDDTLTARYVGRNSSLDIALLKVEKNNMPVIKMGTSKNLQIGQNVLAIGFPLKLDKTTTLGIISNIIDGSKYNLNDINFIQTDAVVNPGNSGGALIDDQGRLIGVVDMLISPTGFYIGYSFAVPIDILKPQIEYAIKMDKIFNKEK